VMTPNINSSSAAAAIAQVDHFWRSSVSVVAVVTHNTGRKVNLSRRGAEFAEELNTNLR